MDSSKSTATLSTPGVVGVAVGSVCAAVFLVLVVIKLRQWRGRRAAIQVLDRPPSSSSALPSDAGYMEPAMNPMFPGGPARAEEHSAAWLPDTDQTHTRVGGHSGHDYMSPQVYATPYDVPGRLRARQYEEPTGGHAQYEAIDADMAARAQCGYAELRGDFMVYDRTAAEHGYAQLRGDFMVYDRANAQADPYAATKDVQSEESDYAQLSGDFMVYEQTKAQVVRGHGRVNNGLHRDQEMGRSGTRP